MTGSRMLRGLAIAMIFLPIAACSKLSDPSANVVAEVMSASEILDKVANTYKSLETYKAEGTIVSELDTAGAKMTVETSFSILLKKPNLYLINWTQANMPMPGMTQSGAVWSDGTQPYLFMGVMNSYSKVSSDEIALAGATGISSGAANTIPSYFFSVSEAQPTLASSLIDPKLELSEKVGDDDCYVISGSSPMSKKEAIWVSKSSFLIRKYYRSLERPEDGTALPEMTETQFDEAIESLGRSVPEESKQQMKELMKRSMEELVTTQMKGSSTELHIDISSPELTAKDFQFTPPQGSILKESLFGELPDDSK